MVIISSTYSPEGLLMQRGNISFNYHANNRLANVDNAGTVLADYSYNAAGERVTKVVNGISTNFFYDEQGQLIGEYDATGNMLAQYVYAPSGRLATLKADGNILFHHNDHLGTPQAMTDSNKRVVWQASYTPFGVAIIDEDPDLDGISETNNFRFPGQYHDAETGLSYNYFRYYDPESGRYITSDPIGLKGGLNTFAYVGGNPVGAVDFFGLILQYADSLSDKVMRPHIKKIMKTVAGQKLLKKLHDSPKKFLIHAYAGDEGRAYYDGVQNVYIDPSYHPKFGSNKGLIPASTTRLLAHELGHMTGVRDKGVNKMDNINAWENPIMIPIEKCKRIMY